MTAKEKAYEYKYEKFGNSAELVVDELMKMIRGIRHDGGSTEDIALRLQIEPYYRFLEEVKKELELL